MYLVATTCCRKSNRLTSKQLVEHAYKTFQDESGLVLEGEDLTVVATGEFVLFESIDRQFFHGLLTAYSTAFVAITLVIVLVLRSLGDALTALTALMLNLFPAAIVLGAVGLFGFWLDVASLMTASLALGIAVDDTIRFFALAPKAREIRRGIHLGCKAILRNRNGSDKRYFGRQRLSLRFLWILANGSFRLVTVSNDAGGPCGRLAVVASLAVLPFASHWQCVTAIRTRSHANLDSRVESFGGSLAFPIIEPSP